MRRPARKSVPGLALALLLGLPLAQNAAATEDESREPVVTSNPLGAKPVQTGVLAAQRGGTQVLNDMRLRGVVANNQAVDVQTGSNFISDGAFAGANGLPILIQNTGNNVVIQQATIVNVQVK